MIIIIKKKDFIIILEFTIYKFKQIKNLKNILKNL